MSDFAISPRSGAADGPKGAGTGSTVSKRRISSLLILGVQVFFASSVSAPAASRPPTTAVTTPASYAAHEAPRVDPDHAVVLLVVDGVRWQDVFRGPDPRITGPR